VVESAAGFTIVRCPRCGLVFVDGCQSLGGLEAFYGPAYFRGDGDSPIGYADYVGQRLLHRRNARSLLRLLEREGPGTGRRLVDLGCAHGFFLAAARERGWTGCGVDISPDAVRYARETLGLEVRLGGPEGAGLESGAFDAVTLIGTIEHVPDPLAMLRGAARLLRPGGLLLITTLDIEGVLRLWEWKPPEHLYYFSFRTLSALVRAAGLEVRWRRWYWAWYAVGDLGARLLRYARLPGAAAIARAADRLGLDRLAIRIPTNEMIVLARKP
jgi:SAM-dependent methyltransferase